MEILELPKSLKDITLQKWVEWNMTYGTNLLNRAKKVYSDKSSDEVKLLFEAEFMIKHYAWYSNTDLSIVEAACYNDIDSQIVEITKESTLSQAMLFREMCEIGSLDLLNTQFKWEDKQWIIVPPLKVADTNTITLAEFERSQDIAMIFSDLQDGDFSALYELCRAYLQTIDGVIIADVEAIKLVPLSIALAVKKYVEDTINLFKALTRDRITDIT